METDSDSDPWDGDPSQNGYSSHQGKSPYRDPNPNLYQWKNFCIVQCSYQGNPPYRESSPYPSLLVEISHNIHFCSFISGVLHRLPYQHVLLIYLVLQLLELHRYKSWREHCVLHSVCTRPKMYCNQTNLIFSSWYIRRLYISILKIPNQLAIQHQKMSQWCRHNTFRSTFEQDKNDNGTSLGAKPQCRWNWTFFRWNFRKTIKKYHRQWCNKTCNRYSWKLHKGGKIMSTP